MKKILNNPFATVRKIMAQAAVLMLFFTAISCEKTEEFEFYPEILSGEFEIFYFPPAGYFTLHSRRHPIGNIISYFPINLPEEFQIDGLQVSVTYRAGKNKAGRLLMEIITIGERIFTSRFVVSYHDDCGYLLFEDLGDETPSVFIPINLSEEFQKDGLRVNVTFHNRGRLIVPLPPCSGRYPSSMKIITIMKTPEESESLSAETRIEGGHNTTISANPWQVFLRMDNRYYCGGIIVAPNLILTALHCIYRPNTESRFSSHLIGVYAGIRCRSEANNSNRFPVLSFITHPNPDVDAVLLRLERPIPFNNNRRSISILSTPYDVDRIARATGWGRTSWNGGFAECLQSVNLRIISNDDASRPRPNGLGWSLQAHQMAATGLGAEYTRQGACPGDSGGPLSTIVANENVLIGIVQQGQPDCQGNNRSSPSVFVRVSAIADWLIQHVPPVITGPTAVCASGISTFSIPRLPANASVRWEADPPLSVSGVVTVTAANQIQAWIRHSGAAAPANSQVRAIISVDEHSHRPVEHIVRHNVVVNRPTIASIQVPPVIQTGSGSLLFTANHNAPTGTSYLWSVSPSHGVTMSGWSSRTANIGFAFPGSYTLTVTVSNVCGAHTISRDIVVTGGSFNPIVTCPYCGTPSNLPPGCWRCPPYRLPCLLSDPIEEEKTNHANYL